MRKVKAKTKAETKAEKSNNMLSSLPTTIYQLKGKNT